MARNLAAFAKSCRNLIRVPAQVSAEFAEYVTRRLQEQYQTKRDVYGNAWERYSAASIRRGRNNLLVESEAMKTGSVAKALSGAGVQMAVGHEDVAVYHMGGTSNMPAREVLPHAGMPARWKAHLEKLVTMQAKRTLQGGG